MLTAIAAFPAYSYQPFRSSPLSMRDPNACSRMNPSHQRRTTPPSTATCEATPFKRQSKYNCLLKNKALERDKRRDLFLKKVKQSGDDKRWEARGEQILRSDFLAQQRRWKDEQARSASEIPAIPEDEVVDFEITPPGRTPEDEFVEERDFEDQSADAVDQHEDRREPDKYFTDYGSDDEEYETILMEAVTQAEAQSSSNLPNASLEGYQDMDMEMS
ncbi:hypothetical protein MMC14_000157 [Varicellaria rhodocarpa]|nr:hypothetical protein [Varicellaria rhodocarpa]